MSRALELVSDEAPEIDKTHGLLAKAVAGLGYEVVDVSGFVDEVAAQAHDQLEHLDAAQGSGEKVAEANVGVAQALGGVITATRQADAAAEESIAVVRQSADRTKTVASWVRELETDLPELEQSVADVHSQNGTIVHIANHVHILAINAKIEAARAGDAGNGFAVVAGAIKELAEKTAEAAKTITAKIESLRSWSEGLRLRIEGVSEDANLILDDAGRTDSALGEIMGAIRAISQQADSISKETQAIDTAGAGFSAAVQQMGDALRETTQSMDQAKTRVNALIDRSEAIVQQTAAIGAASDDSRFIAFAQGQAGKIGTAFEMAIEAGRISQSDLFDMRYQPVPGTDPIQHLAPFTALTDDILPPFLEAALEFDPKVVFSAAVDLNGYLPTHNKKFSHPPSDDPVWNAGNCRNRRIFNDRVGLKAGRNAEPFLLQVYRRDMGGGEFVMMKDLSAPIMVNGRHWGGLRCGYKI